MGGLPPLGFQNVGAVEQILRQLARPDQIQLQIAGDGGIQNLAGRGLQLRCRSRGKARLHRPAVLHQGKAPCAQGR